MKEQVNSTFSSKFVLYTCRNILQQMFHFHFEHVLKRYSDVVPACNGSTVNQRARKIQVVRYTQTAMKSGTQIDVHVSAFQYFWPVRNMPCTFSVMQIWMESSIRPISGPLKGACERSTVQVMPCGTGAQWMYCKWTGTSITTETHAQVSYIEFRFQSTGCHLQYVSPDTNLEGAQLLTQHNYSRNQLLQVTLSQQKRNRLVNRTKKPLRWITSVWPKQCTT